MITRQMLIEAMQPVNGRVPTLREMGDLWGVTRERVRQRLATEGTAKPPSRKPERFCGGCGKQRTYRPGGGYCSCRQCDTNPLQKAHAGDQVRIRDVYYNWRFWPLHLGRVVRVSRWGGEFRRVKYHILCECGKRLSVLAKAFEEVAT